MGWFGGFAAVFRILCRLGSCGVFGGMWFGWCGGFGVVYAGFWDFAVILALAWVCAVQVFGFGVVWEVWVV